MLFNSLDFLIFFPIVVLITYLIPVKTRYLWLLAASYYFYMCWNAKYALLILFSTAVTYLSGVLMEKIKGQEWEEIKKIKYKKYCVAGSFILNFAVLFFFKYSNFAVENMNRLFHFIHIDLNVPVFDFILPVGISFYTFQAFGYTMDVYRDEIYGEKNFFRYALFVSFFPQLVAGPIERSKNLLKQLDFTRKVSFERVRDGLLLMLWGFFLKMVLADRIALFVDGVYGDPDTFGGYFVLVATLLFAVQIYCDFYGYSTIAMGAAQILGIDLMENFNAPYLSQSVAEFWRRWHISLTQWFRDYLYIPLGGSRKGMGRKCLNKVIVFLASGLWHGASWAFVIWGGLNGTYQVAGELLMPARKRLMKVFRLNGNSLCHRCMKIIVTFCLVDFGWLFFRAGGLREAFWLLRSIFTVHNPWILFNGAIYQFGLDSKNFWLMMASIGVLLFADICKYKGIVVRKVIQEQDYWFRWVFIAFSVCFILLFGIWGSAYNGADFIYFQF